MNRRQFVSTAAATGLAAGSAFPYAAEKPRRVGLIGSGWYGKCDLLRLIQVAPVEVVSLCDVDRQMVAEAAEIVASRQASKKKPRTWGDYRKMLAEKDLDIVLVATPDHWHALAAIEAMKAGADVYCQKPISVDVVEGQAMLAAARKYKRVVQIGTQRRSTPHLIEARDRIVKAGKLGKVSMVDVFLYTRRRPGQEPPEGPPPAHIDWEMWCGPAPVRPYSASVHPRRWRQFMEYGNGYLGDMCIHMFDMVRWMLDLGWPKSISSTGGIYVTGGGRANTSDTQLATFDFGDVKVQWTHRAWGDAPDPKLTWGATLYGEKGTLKAGLMGYWFTPSEKNGQPISKDVEYELEQYPEDKTEKDLERHVAPAIRGHMKDFLAAIDKRSRPVADIEQGFISSSSCILANVAVQAGRTLCYDPATGRVKGDEEATRLLRRPYRSPWIHPDPAKV